ncbi:MAG: 4Fe-4S dicluster domain-containing protein [Candidatus Hodarchaeales archaeon]|jgi:heterodisulfide reductase subunit C
MRIKEDVTKIPMEDIDHTFRELITTTFGGERIMSCFQCGTCVGSCPVASVHPDYSPRQIIIECLLGQKDMLLMSSKSTIWLCASCFTCEENCPQGVQITDVIIALRNIAMNAAGYVPEGILEQGLALIDNATISPLTKTLLKRRNKMGLPEMKPLGVEDIQKIAKKTRFKEKLSIVGEKPE